MSVITIHHILEQHTEEVSFLWFLRSRAVNAPHYKLFELNRLDSRVEAHLDGLRVAGVEGWEYCEQALELGEPGSFFAAALLALESKDTDKLSIMITKAEAMPKAGDALISALGWIEPAKLAGTVKELLNSASSFQRYIGLSACAIHRVNPGKMLDELIRAPDTERRLRARALRTAGELKRTDMMYEIRDFFRSEDAFVRYWAAWAAALLGNRGEALEVLKTFTVIPSPQLPDPFPLLLRALPIAQSQVLLKGLAQYPERQRDLLAGVGIIGDPFYIPWLIKQMHIPELARLACESFSFITGADIAYEDLDTDKPEDFESGPNENPADDNVELDSDEDLPWPDPFKIQAWWDAKQHQFQNGHRYLLGVPITEAQCRKVLREGFQRQRAAAALELALLKPNEVLFEVRAPGWRQLRCLQSL